MRVTLAQLEALVWVVRLGSVHEAARQLSVTQPTVSLRLRDLSRALGRDLFEREGRGLRLTGEGRAVLDHAVTVLNEVELVHQLGVPGQAAGLLRLGVSEALALVGLPAIIRGLMRDHPQLRLELSVGTSVNLERDLLAGAIDLALSVDLHADARIKVIELGVQKAGWVASLDLELPPVVTPTLIGHLPILTNPRPSPMYLQTVTWFETAGMVPEQISVSNTLAVIAELVGAGIGLAILPDRLIDVWVPKGRMTKLASDPPLEAAHLCAAHRANDSRPAIAAVLEQARETLEAISWLA